MRWTAAGVLFLSCAAVLALATRWGIGVGPDATAYLGFRPHDGGHAPLYTWLLRLLAAPADDAVAAARWLNVVLYAATATLAWHLVHAATRSMTAAWAGALLLAFTSQGILLYASALSEPAFVLLLVLGFWSLSAWADRQSPRLLLVAAAAAALAALARYPGVALAASGALVVARAARGSYVRKLCNAALYGGIALAPTAAWMIHVARTSGTAGGRSASLAGNADAGTFAAGVLQAAHYVLPTEFPAAVRIAALAAALALLAAATASTSRIRSAPGPHAALPLVLVLFAAAYTGVIVLSVLIEPYLPISARYLFPLYVTAVLLGAVTLPHAARGVGLRRVVAAGVCAFVALGVLRGAKTAAGGFRDGFGYASRSWAASEAAAYVRALPRSAAVYTDGYYALLYLTRKDVHQVPPKIIRRFGIANPDYAAELAAMQQRLAATGGAVVLFAWKADDFELPTPAELAAALPLREQARLRDAVVYTLAPVKPHHAEGDKNDGASRPAAVD